MLRLNSQHLPNLNPIQAAFARAKFRGEKEADTDKDGSESTLRKDVDFSLSTSMPQVGRVGMRSTVTIPDSGETTGIRNAEQGKKFLDKTRYLVPPGNPATLDGLAVALFTTILDLQKAKPMKNAIKCVEAVTHILHHLHRPINEERIAELFNNKVSSQRVNQTDILPKIETMQDSMTKLATSLEEIKDMMKTIKTASDKVEVTMDKIMAGNGGENGNAPISYKNALKGGSLGLHMDPRIRAKEGIKT